ncbi:MAG: hypothetical protein QM756_42670 [Polyangiaceae bacterium]
MNVAWQLAVPTYAVVGFFSALVGAIGFGFVREARREYLSLLTDAGGRSLLSGVATVPTSTRLPMAPLSSKPCLAWQLRVEQVKKRSGRWELARESGCMPFTLEGDGSRRIELAEFEFSDVFPPSEQLRLNAGDELEPTLKERLRHLDSFERIRRASSRAYELREWRLEADSECVLSGVPGDAADGLRLVDVRIAVGALQLVRRRLARALLLRAWKRAAPLLALIVAIVFLARLAHSIW